MSGWTLVALAASLTISINPAVAEGTVPGGTYYNTPVNRTVFTSPSGATQINGITQTQTNGGTLHFNAPGQVVRVDGQINTSAIRNGSTYTGNGGKVLVDAPYFFQNGQISNGSITSAKSPAAIPFVAAPQRNMVLDGKIIPGGTFANTPDGRTMFKNSGNGGLHLPKGNNLRGVEVDSNTGALTGNGGTFHFYAPGQVVRLDGNVDVRGLQNGSGAYIGNGGKVFVDSAYLYQSGNIYANGINGGLVQFNVGSATLTGNARIEAKGFGGQGGIVAINASGVVDIQRQALIDTSGKVLGSIDTNVINIEGGLVNIEGTLQANGIQSRGGTIRLVSTGQTDLSQAQSAITDATTGGTFTNIEAGNANSRLTLLKTNYEGDTRIASGDATVRQAIVIAQGMPSTTVSEANDSADADPRAGDGGTIIVTAQDRILNGGWILTDGARGIANPDGSPTNGGNGGTVSLNAGSEIITSGRIVANGGNGSISTTEPQGGKGGDAGLIAFSYKDGLSNTGTIASIGGHGGAGTASTGQGGNGGLVVFSGPNNPAGNGLVVTPGGSGNSSGLLGSIVVPNQVSSANTWIGVLRKTQPIELLTNAENVLLLRNSHPSNGGGNMLGSYIYNAQVRSVRDQQGSEPMSRMGQAYSEYSSKLFNSRSSTQSLSLFRNLILHNSTNADIYFIEPFSSWGQIHPFNTITLLSNGMVMNAHISAFGNGLGGGRFSSISPYMNGRIAVNGGLAGGSVNIAATDYAELNGDITMGGTLHGGSLIVKSNGRLTVSNSMSGLKATNGGIMGGVQQYFAKTSFLNDRNIEANGGLSGGSIYIRADSIFNSTGHIQANGGQTSGYISMEAFSVQNLGVIEVKGGI